MTAILLAISFEAVIGRTMDVLTTIILPFLIAFPIIIGVFGKASDG